MKILINSFTPNALSESAGSELRNKIIEANKVDSNEEIILDFKGIVLYATMFFNASIGFFIKEDRTEILDKIKIINITSLGERTYKHSKENAFILKDRTKEDVANRIINQTIADD